jgi:hypothetical protein
MKRVMSPYIEKQGSVSSENFSVVNRLVYWPCLQYKRPEDARLRCREAQGYLTYAAAAPAEGNKRWHAEGIVFSKDFPKRVEEIHYMKSKSDFPTEKQARDYAISLGKIWIDRGKKKPPPS